MAATVSVQGIVDALDLAMDEHFSYVNKLTGEVRTVSQDEFNLASRDPLPNVPDWQRQLVTEAREVADAPEDWLELPDKETVDEWEMMSQFVESLSTQSIRRELGDSIQGTGAFRNFKAAVRRHGIEEHWFAFRAQAFRQIAVEWLAERGLLPDVQSP